MFSDRRFAFAALFLSLTAVAPVAAQDYNRPPSDLYDQDDRGPAPYRGGGGNVDQGDPGALSVRVGKLEGRIREMTGQIEELQNANRKLVEQLQKFQTDVEFRLQDKGGARPAKRSDASPAPVDGGTATPDPTLPTPSRQASARPGRNDSFDPSATPNAPGAPRTLGTTPPSAPVDDAPLDLTGGNGGGGSGSQRAGGAGSLAPTLNLPSSSTPSGGSSSTAMVNPAANPTREEFDTALSYYRDKQYEDAEKGFTAFINKNPKSRLVADATFYIGETYAQRGRPREAAEQFLKISNDYANSVRAPEAMVRLGVQLKALGAKEQACAAFSEVGRKYPNAPAYVKTNADRESKRAQC